MTDLDHERALEAAARAVLKAQGCSSYNRAPDHWLIPGDSASAEVMCENIARAAVTAYLAEAGDGRLSELERENARLREALKPFAAQTRASSLTEEKMILAARAALAGSEKP
jgi:hypothetical protein